MSSPEVDQIKAKLDIVALVGGYIKLEKAGTSFKGRCPFHNEKTPSFFVSPDRGSYYCFGCGAKGDIFTFVEQFEGLDFPGALKVLAERAGVELQKFSGRSFGENAAAPDDKTKLFSLVEQACFYFEKNFSENNAAAEYLEKRGLKKETIRDFRIGYAKEEWRGLYDFLMSKGATIPDIERAGLVKQGEKGTAYDTFRSRIMFPMSDSSGRVIAFSGRIFSPLQQAFAGQVEPPKYLNSPETPIFHKSEVLFGLDKAKTHIRRLNYSILVEGQMDLVMMHQAGLENSVASSGTALTEAHLKRLSRLSNRTVLAFDGDTAGLKAIFRAAEIGLSLGMEVKVAEMPAGTDPAELALQDKEKLIELFKKSKHVISFALDHVIDVNSDKRIVARKIAAEVLPLVALLSVASEQSHFVKEIARQSGITEDAIREDLRKIPELRAKSEERREVETEKKIIERSDMILRKLFGIALWKNDESIREKIQELIGAEMYAEKRIEFEKDEAIVFEIEAEYTDERLVHKDITELLDNLDEEILKKRFAETQQLLRRAEMQNDTAEVSRLLTILNTIWQKK